MVARGRRFKEDSQSRFGELRRGARRRLVLDAIRYTSAYRDVPEAAERWLEHDGRTDDQGQTNRHGESNGDAAMPIVMAGHQPTLFHPGVWLKNFVLDRMANARGGLAINLVVDNDVSSGVSIRVPKRDVATQRWRSMSVAYDVVGGGVPYEQTAITDQEYFSGFDKRLHRELLGLVDDPLITGLWPHATAALDRCSIASCAIAQARHALEAEIGLQTLEIPIGVIARDHAFARFTLELLCQLPRFVSIYNDSTEHYRQHHGIRSHAHPVPNLEIQTDRDGHTWYECPLWLYGDRSPHRRGLWGRLEGGDQHAATTLVLSDREGQTLSLDMTDLDAAATQWTDSLSNDFKIRPRALLTTMYSRWILSDCFLHGIGGGKYDQLGDQIAEQFFAITPPPYYVTSGTVHLPDVDDVDVSAQRWDLQRRDLQRRLRDCRFQPESVSDDWDVAERAMIARKRELIANIPPRRQRKNWHDEIDQINRELFAKLGEIRLATAERLDQLDRDAAVSRLLTSREHPFCIYPLDYLVQTFQTMLGGDETFAAGKA